MKKIFQTSIIKALFIAVIAITVTVVANAQPNPGGPGYNGSGTYANGSSASVPFDGGMSLVLAASGIGYAAKKLKRKK